jgi:hypothetical protein
MYSSMEIVVLAAKRQVKGSADGEQGRFNDGADGGELAELRTTAAAPERTVGPDGFRASAIASDPNRSWTFSAEDAAGSSVLELGIGILYPMWWRTKNNPLRASAVETRARRIAWVCRPGGFLCGLAATLSWSVGIMVAEWIALAFGAASALLLLFSYFSDKKAQQSLR